MEQNARRHTLHITPEGEERKVGTPCPSLEKATDMLQQAVLVQTVTTTGRAGETYVQKRGRFLAEIVDVRGTVVASEFGSGETI